MTVLSQDICIRKIHTEAIFSLITSQRDTRVLGPSSKRFFFWVGPFSSSHDAVLNSAMSSIRSVGWKVLVAGERTKNTPMVSGMLNQKPFTAERAAAVLTTKTQLTDVDFTRSENRSECCQSGAVRKLPVGS